MSFAAGFATGFADTFVGRLEDRKDRIQDLVDQGIASAKAVAPRYMQAQGEYKNVLEIGDMLKTRYNVSDEEFVALAQGTDVTELYKSIVQEDAQRTAAGRSGVSKQDFINVIDMPESVLPENMTREQAIAQIMGLQGAKLADEDDPKSEGAQTRARGSSLAEFLGYNPKLSAEKQLEAMKIMGYDVSDLEYFQATQGLKQDVVPGVTRTRDVLFDDIDYDKSSYDGTQRKFNSMLATRLAGADISDPDVFRTTTGIAGDDKQTMRDNALEASMAIAKLELDIVNSGAGLGLIGPAARRTLLEGLFSQVDGGTAGVEELQTLMKNIENGTAINAITTIYNEKGRFTAEDYDAILNGVTASGEAEEEPEGMVSSLRPRARPEGLVAQTDGVLAEAGQDGAEVDEEAESLQARIDAEEDPIVKRVLQNELAQVQANAEEEVDGITYAEWKGMSRKEREEAGYPVSTIGGEMYFKRFGVGLGTVDEDQKFAPKAEEAPEEETATAPSAIMERPEGSMAEKDYESAVEFVQDNDQLILDELESKGLTGESSKDEVKQALTDFYRANQDDPSIGGYIANAPLQDIDMIADVFMLALKNLTEEE